MESALDQLHSEILGAVQAGFFVLPTVMSAAIPDICAALESDDGRSNPTRYRDWYDRWVRNRMANFTADDCYSFRCGVVHQGRMGDLKNSFARAVFPLPNPKTARFTNCIMNDAYVCGVEEFCDHMIVSSKEWFAQNQNEPNVRTNIGQLMKIYPDGLRPYISGLPVLA